ncbi:uncharacterized protein A1O5_12880 [Cladophialophora psammophila CBS 110553]|uniref:Uncharacterized protein n=1 Tax=Cladophialophora psammophila CBS 110553 TaxID=1182543 RepID=W9W8T2_9EURO|nr:uncharacterized protein A1O5_12880 [Cladophialophora psammophila CBS 110553]EXJ54969.1 hypothetical protein A1O5_12880 [Cladophialophora psammophila CBS 110553]
MASQSEGSNPHSPLEGWSFLDSDTLSEFSTSSSLEELYEQNRLHLTVNPLDPFLPTIRPDGMYSDLIPDELQPASPPLLDTDYHIPVTRTDLDHPAGVLGNSNAAFPGAEYRLEGHLEASVFADSDLASDAAPSQMQISLEELDANTLEFLESVHTYDFLERISAENSGLAGMDFLADTPTEFAPELNQSQAVQGLDRLNTFDGDFWFSVPTEVDIWSPMPPDMLDNNGHQLFYPRAAEEVQLNSMADMYGYSELLAQPAPGPVPQDLAADALPTPADQGTGHPGPFAAQARPEAPVEKASAPLRRSDRLRTKAHKEVPRIRYYLTLESGVFSPDGFGIRAG